MIDGYDSDRFGDRFWDSCGASGTYFAKIDLADPGSGAVDPLFRGEAEQRRCGL